MKQKFKTVILPTGETSFKQGALTKVTTTTIHLTGNDLCIAGYSYSGNTYDGLIPLHLYIISMDEIHEGDSYIYFDMSENPRKVCKSVFGVSRPDELDRKIIASTDKNLTPGAWIDLSKSQWIIDYYNKNKKLPFVIELETEESLDNDTIDDQTKYIEYWDDKIKIIRIVQLQSMRQENIIGTK